MREVTHHLIGGAVALAIAAAGAFVAPVKVRAADDVCHKPETLKADLYADEQTAIYGYVGQKAQALATAAAHIIGGPVWIASTVSLVFVITTGELELYIYGADGCCVTDYDGGNLEGWRSIFTFADVVFPLGSTYYQLPGAI